MKGFEHRADGDHGREDFYQRGHNRGVDDPIPHHPSDGHYHSTDHRGPIIIGPYGGGNRQSAKGVDHFRRRKKQILDHILQSIRYDKEIRPPGHVNDTSGWSYCY